MSMDSQGGFGQIMSMVRGFQVAKMLMVAVDLGVFDFLVEPKSAVETAAWLKADPRSTVIFLNGLVGLELLDKDGDKFSNGGLASRYLDFVHQLRTSAGSHERLAVVEVFGRYSGETSLVSAYGRGSTGRSSSRCRSSSTAWPSS